MTTMGWMVYMVAIGLPLAAAAWLWEHGLGRVGLPSRWVWCGSLLLCVALPTGVAVGDRAPEPHPAAPSALPALTPPTARTPAGAHIDEGGPLDAVAVWLATWRATLDRGLAATASLLGDGRPGLSRWIAGAWLAASLLATTLLLGSARRLAHRVRTWPRETLLGRSVRLAPDLGPATVGLLRPVIVVPTWVAKLESTELELILTHEEEHVRRHDPLLLALGVAVVVACPWNPLVWWQHRRLRDAVEVDCDRRVLRRGAVAPSYGKLLLRMGSRRGHRLLPTPTINGSFSLLERRLAAMKTTKLGAALPRALGTTVASLALVVVACTTEAPAGSGAAELGPTTTVLDRNDHVADLWVEPDGRVYVNDVLYMLEDVSDVIGRLEAASAGDLVVAVAGHPAVPYGVMARLQSELQAAGALRVSFVTSTSRPGPTPPGDPRDVADGLGITIPEAGPATPQQVSVRNVLFLAVRADGAVDARRGAASQVQQIRPADVEGLWRHDVAMNPYLIAAVKVHPQASYASMVKVLDALHAANARRISLQVLEEPGGGPG